MSAFVVDDTVAFKEDPSIIGTIESTWSDTDGISPDGFNRCYLHKSLPLEVESSWFADGQLSPRYVIVAFLLDYDGYCIVSEDSLRLLDRALTAGDVVKKRSSDAQSGVVISTSISCELHPLCSEAEYNTKCYIPAEGHISTNGPGPRESRARDGRDLLNGFASSGYNRPIPSPDMPHRSSPLKASAHELNYWHSYREEDFVLYRNWVGQIEEVYNDVTVRLANGSVVVVEDEEELEVPYWIPGSPSYQLVQRLDRAGYYRRGSSNSGKPKSEPWSGCHPGQRVQTKKGNLRRGRWKFGAYDSTIPPQGLVVDVRCIELSIRWICPNQSLPLRNQAHPPPSHLGLDELESEELLVYDRSSIPRYAMGQRLPNASYSPDIGYGRVVRFKDPALVGISHRQAKIDVLGDGPTSSAACVGSEVLNSSSRIPRATTQGFDMNVLQVTSTSTKVLIRWQDCAITEEASVHLQYYHNSDEHEVWPGDKVSMKAEEQQLDNNGPGSLRAHKIGVVQQVDAVGRMAQVRWYVDAMVEMDDERSYQIHGSRYGRLGDEISSLPLYDLAAHRALAAYLGDLAVTLPGKAPNSRDLDESCSELEPFWFGEVVDICLDGDVILRSGAASVVRDVKVPADQILVVASDDTESESEYSDVEDDDSDWSEMSELSIDAARGKDAIGVSFEDESGNEMSGDANEDDVMWTTDDEDEDEGTTRNDEPLDSGHTSAIEVVNLPTTTAQRTSELDNHGEAIHYSNISSAPLRFSVLEVSPPTDHHYFGATTPLAAGLMRRISKENKIMQESLPDGVFVRSWDSRLDLARVLIVGPHNTPYEFAPFVFDLQYSDSFPTSPPDIFFHSWTNRVGRINPNLYEDGKICLSLLGTWNADDRNEAWSTKSTILQLLVSILGLVLVREPYYSKHLPALPAPLRSISYDDLSAFGSSTRAAFAALRQ